jgi:uncharacterized Zn-binding protein involved in type VI secretion
VQAAARLNDPIAHTSAMEGLAKGALAGALVGAGLVLGAALIVGTGGLTAPLVIGVMLTGIALGASIGEFVGSLSFFNKKAGKIATGSPNVFVNFKPLARAQADTGECSEHGPECPPIATGSDSVFINGFPAARVDDLLDCSGFIVEGSPNVFIGGEQVRCKSVNPEVSGWVHGIVMVAGIAGALLLGGVAVIPGIVGGFALGYVGGEVMGLVGREAGDWLSENIGGKPSDWEKAGTFVGQALGGWLGAKGGPKAWELAKRIEAEPNTLGMNGGNIRTGSRQRPLKTKEISRAFKGEEIPNNPNNWLVGRSTVEYLNEVERAKLLLTVKEGKLYDAEGNLFDTTEASTIWSGPNRAIYVMDEDGNFYASLRQERGIFHHSSILAGKPVAGAGEIEVNKGVLQYINRGSGHYEPTPEMLQQTVDELRVNGLRFGDWVIDPDW